MREEADGGGGGAARGSGRGGGCSKSVCLLVYVQHVVAVRFSGFVARFYGSVGERVVW